MQLVAAIPVRADRTSVGTQKVSYLSSDLQAIKGEGTWYIWIYCDIDSKLNSIAKVMLPAMRKINHSKFQICFYPPLYYNKVHSLHTEFILILYWAFQTCNSYKSIDVCLKAP